MLYQFKTTATMKPYNNKKWWIDSDIIREITITAENIKQALKEYQTIVKNNCYIDISDNAINRAEPMYTDLKNGETIQTGFVITAKTEFQDDNNYKWSTQFIDLWVKIQIVSNPFIEV